MQERSPLWVLFDQFCHISDINIPISELFIFSCGTEAPAGCDRRRRPGRQVGAPAILARHPRLDTCTKFVIAPAKRFRSFELETSARPSRKWPIALVVVLIIGAALVFGYVSYSYAGKDDDSVTTTTFTQTGAVTVFKQVSGGNVSGIDAQAIYGQDNESVVTVYGYVAATVQTFFGSATELTEQLGSGFVVHYGASYYVVTNFHVVNSATNITVSFWNGDAYPSTVIGTDPYSDLAVIQVNGAPLSEYHPIGLTSSSALQVGQPVVVIGNPFGLSGSMTSGIISQLERTISESTTGPYDIADVIQFSAPINPGNSGGPLLDSQGLVVGITTATASGSQGVGFAIPSDAIIRELPYLISTGSYSLHPYIGINGTDVDYQVAQAAGTNVTYGVLIESVAGGSPAQKAGLRAGTDQVTIEGQEYLIGGDIIVSVNGTRIVDFDSLLSYVEEHALPGTVLELGIIRDGSPMTIPVTVAARPS